MPSNPESPPLPPKLQARGQMRRNKGSRCVAQHCIVAIITAAVSLRRRHPPVSTQVTDHGIRLSFRFTSKASRAVGAGVVAWVVPAIAVVAFNPLWREARLLSMAP